MNIIKNRFIAAGIVLSAVFCVSLFSCAHKEKNVLHEGDRISDMKQRLNLSDDQVAKIKAIYAESRTNIRLLMKQNKADIEILKYKVKSGASDNDLTNILKALKIDNQKIRNVRINEMEKVNALLTPSQQAQEIISMSESVRISNGKDKHKK